MTKAMYIGIPNNPTVTLPSGYTQLEYIESTGTQYIDTGFKPNQNTRVICVLSSSTANDSFFGSQSAWGSASFSAGTNTVSYGSSNSTSISLNNGKKREIVFDNGKLYADGSLVWSGTAQTFTIPYNMYVFANNEKNTTAYYSHMKLYSCQIYDNDTLVRNFIPVKNSSGTIGLYDVTNSKFYTNSGSGTFTAGTVLDGKNVARKVNKMYVGVANKPTVTLPSGYTQVEYIESSGTQYIDTGFVPNQDTRVVCDFHSLTTGTTVPFGYRKDANGTLAFAVYTSSSKVMLIYNGKFVTGGAYSNERGVIDFDSQNSICYFDGTQTATVTKASFQCGGSMYLFAFNTGGSASDFNPLRMYSCKIYDNDTLVRNFIPARNGSGTFGLYDTVNNAFHTNSGSGVFVAGKTLDGKSLARKVKKAYIGVNGIARWFFGGKELNYKGTTSNLSVARGSLVGATVGNYALFAGGTNGSIPPSSTVDTYDVNLTKGTASSMYMVRHSLASTTIGDYALFAGGYGSNAVAGAVESYSTSLTRESLTSLSTGRSNLAGASVGNYALFAGGQSSSSNYLYSVEAYNSSLTHKSVESPLQFGCANLAATTVGNYALFAGGYTGNSTYTAFGVAYDGSLTKKNLTNLSVARAHLAGATVGNYALFAGGQTSSTVMSDAVDIYDASLTKISTTLTLSVARTALTATTLDGYAIFGGGSKPASELFYTNVDVFDESLTMTTISGLSVGRQQLASATIGNYALFAGGYNGSYQSTVDVYEVA